jgi:hypothetical protein
MAVRPKQGKKRPTAQELFAWAEAQADAPTIRQCADHFKCRNRDIEDAVDAADNGEHIPGGYLGLAVALRSGAGMHELHGGRRLVEAYYAPDGKGKP